jgi:hypothetical protein
MAAMPAGCSKKLSLSENASAAKIVLTRQKSPVDLSESCHISIIAKEAVSDRKRGRLTGSRIINFVSKAVRTSSQKLLNRSGQ